MSYKKLTNFIRKMKKSPYSEFPKEVQLSMKRTFTVLAIVAVLVLAYLILSSTSWWN